MTEAAIKTDEDYYRAEWMTDDQWECAEMLADLFYGWHHMPGTIKRFGRGIEVNTGRGRLATYDFNDLTRAVLMAHERCIRFELLPSGPGMLKLSLHKRHTREGSMYQKHPTIEQAIADFRKAPR